ncbi:hypothetical protein HMI56_000244 [Coelomomyces lativittatus]|nr:hypothetical protein HMI56_000244 [Coelomomyces lativittatus]
MFISTLKTTHSLLRRQLRWGGLGHEHRPFLTPLPSRVFPSVSSSVLFFPTPLPLHVRTSSMRPFSSLKINTHPLRSNGKGTPFLKDFKRRWVWTVVGIAGGGSMVVIWGVGLYMGWVGTNNTLHDDPSLTSTWWYTSGLKENLRAMYAHKSTWELGRTWVLMELMQHSGFMETLLKVSPEWVTWGLTWVPGLTHFMKFTWFNQFCGGENEMEMKVTLRKLAHTFSSSTLASTSTLIPIIDIANEDVGEMDLDTHTSNSSFEALQPWILSALRLAKDHQTEFKQPVMLALKGSALMDMPRLQQLAGTVETGMGLVDKGQDQDQTKEARVRVGSTSSPEWTELMRRFTWVVDQAKQQKVPVMVDAETSDIQPVLDQVYLELAQRFNPKYDHENHTDPVWVYQTYQMYLKNGLEKLQHDHQWCLAHGVKLGVKLVRGGMVMEDGVVGVFFSSKKKKKILYDMETNHWVHAARMGWIAWE